jgi:hypothetical protein
LRFKDVSAEYGRWSVSAVECRSWPSTHTIGERTIIAPSVVQMAAHNSSVRLNAISYWRADFKLNLQRYSVLDQSYWIPDGILQRYGILSNTNGLQYWLHGRQLYEKPVIHPHEMERIGKHKPTSRYISVEHPAKQTDAESKKAPKS